MQLTKAVNNIFKRNKPIKFRHLQKIIHVAWRTCEKNDKDIDSCFYKNKKKISQYGGNKFF